MSEFVASDKGRLSEATRVTGINSLICQAAADADIDRARSASSEH